MKKIEKIVKEMEQMIANNNLKVDDVIGILYDNVDYGVETGKWAYYATNVAELRDVIGTINWRRMESAFHGFVLDKDTVKEFYYGMDEDNQAYFVWEIWRNLLCGRIVEGEHWKNERKNIVTLFEVDDLLKDFEEVVFKIAEHNN